MSRNPIPASPLAESYQRYHRQQIQALCTLIRQSPPFNDAEAEISIQSGGTQPSLQDTFLENLTILEDAHTSHETLAATGQWVISTIVGAYPHITPHVPRDLFWYFGGDCLHFLGDEEIAYYQAIDEAFHLAQNDPDQHDTDYEHIVRHVAGQSSNYH